MPMMSLPTCVHKVFDVLAYEEIVVGSSGLLRSDKHLPAEWISHLVFIREVLPGWRDDHI